MVSIHLKSDYIYKYRTSLVIFCTFKLFFFVEHILDRGSCILTELISINTQALLYPRDYIFVFNPNRILWSGDKSSFKTTITCLKAFIFFFPTPLFSTWEALVCSFIIKLPHVHKGLNISSFTCGTKFT